MPGPTKYAKLAAADADDGGEFDNDVLADDLPAAHRTPSTPALPHDKKPLLSRISSHFDSLAQAIVPADVAPGEPAPKRMLFAAAAAATRLSAHLSAAALNAPDPIAPHSPAGDAASMLPPHSPPPRLKSKLSDSSFSELAQKSGTVAAMATGTSRSESMQALFSGGGTSRSRRATGAHDATMDLPEEPTSEPAPAVTGWRARLKSINPGLPLMVLNSLLGSVISLAVKMLASMAQPYPTFELVFVRSLVVFLCCMAWKVYKAPSLAIPAGVRAKMATAADVLLGPPGARLVLFGRSLFGFLSVVTYYVSVRYLSLGEATVISFTSPIFVGIFARVFLKEKWERIDAAAATISLLGVSVIANPSILDVFMQSPTVTLRTVTRAVTYYSEEKRLLAIIFGLVSAVSGATVYIFLRLPALRPLSPVHILTTFSILSTVFATFGSWIFDGSPAAVLRIVPSTFKELLFLGPMLSLTGLLAQVCLATALKFEKASKCTTMNFLQVVFSFLLDLGFRGIVPHASDIVGASIIVSCVLLVSVAKLRSEAKNAAAARAAAARPTLVVPAVDKMEERRMGDASVVRAQKTGQIGAEDSGSRK
ncbi:hypothetical protein AMAG_07785 [Allomyces macrogynus ATCC 38327]|uniref:EamA domain-containing protein n=1 Tax=Allomyces macrogynus (strain ATCC 38327) TaxID=578462 RepID=A0A0L0SJB7_ALLM3|nr:hypothetical protein AMAG_07785 [Allomyces macrogynus ATCC 38327]|eukprot:KNE62582.1 hypothetical protein AMAG_07785 [Allomyces macrogynus ATCC 38327]